MKALIMNSTASLIKGLLNEWPDFVFTSRFQSDPLERRFSRYRQISGGRFLVTLREVQCPEKILQIKSLLKENLNFWRIDVDLPTQSSLDIEQFVPSIENEIEEMELDNESSEVAVFIAGYMKRKLLKNTECEDCQKILSASDSLLLHLLTDSKKN